MIKEFDVMNKERIKIIFEENGDSRMPRCEMHFANIEELRTVIVGKKIVLQYEDAPYQIAGYLERVDDSLVFLSNESDGIKSYPTIGISSVLIEN